jgi:hypothetical protein
MFSVLSAKVGMCLLCTGMASKEKEVFICKGPVSGDLCADHLFALAQQKPSDEKEVTLFNRAG